MMSGEHGVGQVVERSAALSTEIMLAIRLDGIMSVFDNVSIVAMGTFDAFRPTKLSHHLVTSGVIDQSVNVESHPAFDKNLLTILRNLPDFGDCTMF
jgi:hypothetical protein